MYKRRIRTTTYQSAGVLTLATLLLFGLVPTAKAGAARGHEAGERGRAQCNRPHVPGTYSMTIPSGGMDRTVIVHVPASYKGRHRVPMVLNLHGSSANALTQMSISALAAAADKYGFIAVAPQGAIIAGPGYSWNVPGVTLPEGQPPDDEQFLDDTIEAVAQDLCIDETRVYGTGYSGGGRMISQYACDRAERIAAIAPVVGLRAGYPVSGEAAPDPTTCLPVRPVPVLAFAGTEDRVNPYAGGGAPYWQYGTLAALERWADIDSCGSKTRRRQVTEHVSLLEYRRCDKGVQVALYIAEGAGHTWPGSEFSVDFYQGRLGEVNMEIDATDLMWRFFRHHSLRRGGR